VPDDDSPPLHDIADRVLRKTLQHPVNLKAFLEEVLKDLAKGFDCARAKLLPRDFLPEDWRGREADLLFEIPYQSGEGEQIALVCVLIEHQSRPDPRMPLRTLLYSVLYWEREWRNWETMATPRPEFRMTPVVPIVLHTSPRTWTSPRTITDLLGGPAGFHLFAPRWEPLFWELANHSSQELLDSREAFFRLLAVARAEDLPAEEFEPIFVEAMRRLGKFHDTDRVLWSEMLSAVLTWACSRRTGVEKTHWQAVAESAQEDETRRKEMANMKKTIADAFMEEGAIKTLKRTILRQGQTRFGAPDENTLRFIDDIDNIDQLEVFTDRVHEANSWSDLLNRSSVSEP